MDRAVCPRSSVRWQLRFGAPKRDHTICYAENLLIHQRAAIVILAAFAACGAQGATYVGMASCATCHSEIHRQWTHSRHSKMVQPATIESVQGNFKLSRVKLRDAFYGLRERDGSFYITESYLTGKPQCVFVLKDEIVHVSPGAAGRMQKLSGRGFRAPTADPWQTVGVSQDPVWSFVWRAFFTRGDS